MSSDVTFYSNPLITLFYNTYPTALVYVVYFILKLLILRMVQDHCRWPDKKYHIISPPPVARKPPAESKAAKQGRKSVESILVIAEDSEGQGHASET